MNRDRSYYLPGISASTRVPIFRTGSVWVVSACDGALLLLYLLCGFYRLLYRLLPTPIGSYSRLRFRRGSS